MTMPPVGVNPMPCLLLLGGLFLTSSGFNGSLYLGGNYFIVAECKLSGMLAFLQGRHQIFSGLQIYERHYVGAAAATDIKIVLSQCCRAALTRGWVTNWSKGICRAGSVLDVQCRH